MSKFDPEQDGWPLRDAIMQTAWQDLLAVIRHGMQELQARGVPFEAPDWWSERVAPPATACDGADRSEQQIMLALQCNLAAAETKFRDDLYEGKLVCWGRPGSSLAKYERAPAWGVTGIESWWKGGGIVRLESGERLYAARVEPSGSDKPEAKKVSSGGRPPLPYKETVITQTLTWLDQEGGRPIAEIKAVMINFIDKVDDSGGPSDSTLKAWAKEALAEHRRRCEAGLR